MLRSVAVLALASVLSSAALATNLLEDTVAPERPIDVSLALDTAGTPHIAYTIGTSLKHAVKSAGTWSVATVDSTGLFQSGCALAVDASGAPHVCWSPNGAWYAEKTSGVWNAEPIDPSAASSQVALALDASGVPHVVYKISGGDLKYAVRTGSGWVTEPIDPQGWGPSLVFDADGDPHVAYALSTGPLKYAVRKSGNWTYVTVDSVATSGGSGYFDPPTLRLDAGGDPHLSYMANDPDFDLKYAERAGGVWTTTVVDSVGFVGWYNSLALDAADRPHVTYTGGSDELVYARHDGGAWVFETLDPVSGVGDFNSLALTFQGPHVACRDYPGNRLLYLYPDPATGVTALPGAAAELRLEAPRPNPQVGAGAVTFAFTIPAPETVRLTVHDVRGRSVTAWPARAYPAGSHRVSWEPGAAASGVYWIRLITDSGRSAAARWVLLR
jgi:hypothetical protein